MKRKLKKDPNDWEIKNRGGEKKMRGKIAIYLIRLVLFIGFGSCLMLLCPDITNAAISGPLTDFPAYYTEVGPTDTIPVEYTFIPQANINTRYYIARESTRKLLRVYTYNSTTPSANKIPLLGGEEAAYFKNVGTYNGKVVDMMVSIPTGFTGYVGYNVGYTEAYKYNFGTVTDVRNEKDGKADITYSYYDSATGKPLIVKGMFSLLIGGNFYEYDWIPKNMDKTYFSSNSELSYDPYETTYSYTRIGGLGDINTSVSDQPENILTGVYTNSSVTIRSVSRYIKSMGIYFVTTPIARMKIPTPIAEGSIEKDGSKHETSFSIKMNQYVPKRLSTFSKYSSLDYSLPTNDLYNVNSFKVFNYETGKDVSSMFALSDNKLSVTPTSLALNSFYGKTYQVNLNYDLDTTKDYFSLYKDGYLEIPYGSITQDSDLDGVQLSNDVSSKIKWDYQLGIEASDVEYGQGDIKRFNKDPEAFKEKVLKDSEAKGTNLNLNTDIPVTITDFVVDSKAGTYPITLSTQDGDITFTKKINVKVKAVPPVVTIPEAGTRVVSSKGMPYSFSGTVSDEDSEDMSLFVTVDNGSPTTIWEKQENTELNQPIDFTYEIPGAQLLVLGDHTVKVYAKDSEGNQSEVAQFTLDVRGYLAFKDMPPETLDFEQAKIGSKGSYSKLNKSVDFSVEDYRGSNTSWKLVGSLTSELQDSATKTTIKDGIIYRDEDGNETPFTTDATVKLSTGKATASNVLFPIKWGTDDKGIFIKTPPDVKKGTYTGGIEMSLVDAP